MSGSIPFFGAAKNWLSKYEPKKMLVLGIVLLGVVFITYMYERHRSGAKYDALIASQEKAVAAKLLDPDAAKFRNTFVHNGYALCGEVNGKNSFGGYVGYRQFYAWGGDGMPEYVDIKSDTSTQEQFMRCYKYLNVEAMKRPGYGEVYRTFCSSIDTEFWLHWKQFCVDKLGETEF